MEQAWFLWLTPLLSLLSGLSGAEISWRDICGNKLQESCPDSVNTKIIGGVSTCAEKVPWNVLVENTAEKRAPGKIAKTELFVCCLITQLARRITVSLY